MELEQSYRKSRLKLIMNLGASYNQITLEKLHKTKHEIDKKKIDNALYDRIHSDRNEDNGNCLYQNRMKVPTE